MNMRNQTKTILSATTVRSQFGRIIKEAGKNNGRFIVQHRDGSTVVILGLRDFISTIAPEPEVLTLIGEASKRKGTAKFTMREIDTEIAADKHTIPKV